MKKVRKISGLYRLTHFLAFPGFAALPGVTVGNKFLIYFVVLSFAGATCGSFVKVIDTIKGTK